MASWPMTWDDNSIVLTAFQPGKTALFTEPHGSIATVDSYCSFRQ
jgi:hypothetical protein